MITAGDILDFAKSRGPFTSLELRDYASQLGKELTPKALNMRLARMIEGGSLTKIARGIYEIANNSFVPYWDYEMATLSEEIKSALPFLKMCIWNIQDLRRFSHHITNQQIIYVDVEKDGVEAVFNFLQNQTFTNRMIAMEPSLGVYSNYIGSRPTIVVRQLITRAPVYDKTKTTIEKLMVDANVDHDFFAFQGYEMTRIFRNIYSTVKVNERRLLAYAKRRHCLDAIKQLINDKDNYDND